MRSSLSLFHRAALFSLGVCAVMAPASARQWNPDARGAALDYTQILHAKPTGQIVVVWWVVPETFANDANSQILKDVLSRYVIVGLADGRTVPGGGNMSFTPVADLRITDQTGRSIAALAPSTTPPEVTQATTSLQALGRQSLGPIGQGMRWFVFDGSTIHSCTPGKMSVPFGGYTYPFDTPIPGCPK